jgi:E3 ubiquitin-protein ligase RFWD3
VVLIFVCSAGYICFRPQLLTEMDSQRVCISLACAPQSSDVLVASFRPKVEASEDGTASQVYLSQAQTQPVGSGKLGHHALVRRTGNASFTEGPTCYANVSEVRMSKSAMIPYGDSQHLFAYGDESLRGVRTWHLPSFAIHADLSPHRQPILDLRYAESSGGGRYLGCLSGEKLEVFKIS